MSEFLPGKGTTASSHEDTDGIELRLAAKLEHLPIIRSLAATLAIRADFDLDSIADLKLAVDEVCSTLITRAAPGGMLGCQFHVLPDEIRFAAVTGSNSAAEPSQDSFGWRVLTTLTDEARSWVDGGLVHISIAKRKTPGG